MPKKSKVKLVLCLSNNGQFLQSYHPLIRTLKKIKKLINIPVVAIGGINEKNYNRIVDPKKMIYPE